MLSGLAERLDELTAASDIVGRIEGDCCGILRDYSNEESAAETSEKIIFGVRETPIKTMIGDARLYECLLQMRRPDGQNARSRADVQNHLVLETAGVQSHGVVVRRHARLVLQHVLLVVQVLILMCGRALRIMLTGQLFPVKYQKLMIHQILEQLPTIEEAFLPELVDHCIPREN